MGSVELAAWVMVAEPWDTPVTVTSLAESQSDGVNVTPPDTVAFPGTSLVGVTVTFAVGSESSTTV